MWKQAAAAVALAVGTTLSGAATVELNKGTAADLDGLPGVGPAMSRRILDARQKEPFKDWTDFMARVKGVKSRTARKLSDAGLTVNGEAYRAAARHAAR